MRKVTEKPKKATKNDRRLVVRIETSWSESYFRKMHGDKGLEMTDNDLKHFSIDAFLKEVYRDAENGLLRNYAHFSFEEADKD